MLQDCYNGDLTLDKYLRFIENASYIRNYSLEISEQIDWDEVIAGIRIRLEKCTLKDDDEYWARYKISEDSRKHFIKEESISYSLIDGFRKNEVALFGKNKRLYLDTIKAKGISVFDICKNKRFDVFDNEMTVATCECFDNCKFYDKAYFPSWFRKMWQYCDSSADYKKEVTKEGVEHLIGYLNKLIDKYNDIKHQIAFIHTKHFVDVVQELIDKLDEAMGIKENKEQFIE